MPRLTRMTTHRGDDGSTSLASGQRAPKDSLRVEASGAVDELNSCLGLALTAGLHEHLEALVRAVQNDLFHLGTDLCFTETEKQIRSLPRLGERHIQRLDQALHALQADLKALDNFVLPGGAPGAAHLHVARAVCRRAERRVVALSRQEPVGPLVLPYLNRLGDVLFAMARWENLKRQVPELTWNSRA